MTRVKTKKVTEVSEDMRLVEGEFGEGGTGNEFKFLQYDSDIVLVAPVIVNSGKVSYVMKEVFRPSLQASSLEFIYDKSSEMDKAKFAKSMIKDESGLDLKMTKFIYSFFSSISSSSRVVNVYIALVEDEASLTNDAKIISADELLIKVQENEIRDSNTLAALSAVMLQSDEAKRYLNDLVGQES